MSKRDGGRPEVVKLEERAKGVPVDFHKGWTERPWTRPVYYRIKVVSGTFYRPYRIA